MPDDSKRKAASKAVKTAQKQLPAPLATQPRTAAQGLKAVEATGFLKWPARSERLQWGSGAPLPTWRNWERVSSIGSTSGATISGQGLSGCSSSVL